jgi:hypothetical protein
MDRAYKSGDLAMITTLGIPQFRSKEEKFEGFWIKKVEESK